MKDEWTISTLKEYFERLIEERDKAIDAAHVTSSEAIRKEESRLSEILEGFPQKYAQRSELETIELQINAVRADHVQRSEFADLKETIAQGRGARLALIAASGIIITLIGVALGAMYHNQLTRGDVSRQIEIESPWAQDKPLLEQRIQKLETKVILLETQIATHEATDKLRSQLRK